MVCAEETPGSPRHTAIATVHPELPSIQINISAVIGRAETDKCAVIVRQRLDPGLLPIWDCSLVIEGVCAKVGVSL
jgi:hypothetical protein